MGYLGRPAATLRTSRRSTWRPHTEAGTSSAGLHLHRLRLAAQTGWRSLPMAGRPAVALHDTSRYAQLASNPTLDPNQAGTTSSHKGPRAATQ
jgi:hypothetical protein